MAGGCFRNGVLSSGTKVNICFPIYTLNDEMAVTSFLLFDLGGVLIENAVFSRLAALLPEPAEEAVLRRRWLASSAIGAFERGELGRDEFAAQFIAEWDLPLSPAAFLEEFHAWPRGFFPGAQALLRELRLSYQVGCLSNCNEVHWEKFGGFGDEFDIALSSHRLGAIKPEAEAFRRALGVCGYPPEEILFFDDTQDNVLVARQFGLRAFRVDGVAAIRQILINEGILLSNLFERA